MPTFACLSKTTIGPVRLVVVLSASVALFVCVIAVNCGAFALPGHSSFYMSQASERAALDWTLQRQRDNE